MNGRKSFTAVCLAVLVGAPAGQAGDLSQVRQNLGKMFPRLTIDSVAPGPMEGIVEITSGQNIIYYAPRSGNLIFGEIWTGEGKNITAKRREDLVAAKAGSNLGLLRKELNRAVKIGNGPREVIEITDPDCPYCRRMHEYWEKRKDVTRYVFFFPLKQLHPKAEAKVRFILAADQKERAMREVYGGKYDSDPVPEADDRGAAAEHQALVARTGISGTPGFFVEGTFVGGANVQGIEKIIGAPAAPATR